MQQYPWLGFKVRAVYCLKGVGCFAWERNIPCLPGFLRLPDLPPGSVNNDISSALQARLKEVGTLAQSKASNF